ncbi:hypothetical protein [Cytobacillus massiliigabonensis]|uniref:hypothetical protein n=1 Tax=Cytobacillus massiliigabonensis TaxID=1871011 RepID=UPI000C8313F9|nr:hypothetical protein [Cytobacillus massiliigabonensis]
METLIQNLDLTAKGIWFPIALGIISLLYILFMPKHISWKVIYLTFGIGGFMATLLDVIVMSGWLDVFDLGQSKIPGLGDLISYSLIAPCFAVIFLNYFNPEKKWKYVVLFTLLSFLSEWMLVKVGYMKLKGWNTWWSLPVYFFIFGFWLPWHLRVIKMASEN